MSKPMLVTFPLTLLLFDLWPLRRTQWPRTILEKLPLLALSLSASVITFMVQRSAGAVKMAPLAIRIENAFITYLIYVKQAFVPTRLAVFYPYPSSIAAWQAAAAFVVVLAISVLAIQAWRERPYLTVGWFWYLGTLVPVIGLVQVGQQAHADRYTYVPLVGLSIMLAWGGAEVAAKWPRTKPALAAAAVISCAVCMVLARQEASYWQNSETLYQRAIAVTQRNQVAENNLGMYLMRQGNADAIPHFEAALRIDPDLIEAHNNLGLALSRIPGRAPDSMEQFEAVLRVHPDNAEAHNGLGAALMRRGEWTAAIPHFEAALRVNPGHAIANNNLGTCQVAVGNYAAAVPYFEAAIRANPDFAEAHFSLAGALAKIPGRVPDAINEYKTALQLRPNEGLVRLIHTRLGMLLADQGHREEAIAHLEAAQQAHPDTAISKMIDRLRAGQR